MSDWVLKIIGIVFIGLLLDFIYPSGKTKNITIGVFGIISVFILVSPLINLKNEIINNDRYDETISFNINKSKGELYEKMIINTLNINDIKGVNVEIYVNLKNNDFEIDNIYVDVSELVLTENITNINKYEVLTQKILEIVDIDSERIIFYG